MAFIITLTEILNPFRTVDFYEQIKKLRATRDSHLEFEFLRMLILHIRCYDTLAMFIREKKQLII